MKLPSRNTLYTLQGVISNWIGDIDEYHFYASGRSSRFDQEDMKHGKKVLKDITKEIERVQAAAQKYVDALMIVRAKIEEKNT